MKESAPESVIGEVCDIVDPVHFDHHDEKFISDRMDVYERMRNRCPVVRSDTYGGFWILTTYKEVFAVAHDDVTFSSQGSQLIPPGDDVGFLPPIQADPPDVERYRALLGPHLLPKSIARLEPAIREDVEGSVARFLETGAIEVVEEVGRPIPARATMRLLGLSPGEWQKFGGPLHDASTAEPGSVEDRDARARVLNFTRLIEAEVDLRLAGKRDEGLISGLVVDAENGSGATRQDIVDLVRMVIFGGMDTVSAAIANMFAILATRDDLRKRLVADPQLIPKAIEEILRLEAPIQGFSRTVNVDTEIAGIPISQGDRVWLTWGSANLDPEAFHDPRTIDIGRTPNRHMAFGVGAHRCLGSSMARTQLRIVFESFMSRAPEFSLAGPGIVPQRTIGQMLGKRAVHLRLQSAPSMNRVQRGVNVS